MKRNLILGFVLGVAVLCGVGAVYVDSLRDLFDVNVSGVTNGQTITYTNGIWYASTMTAAAGNAPTNTATATNGVAQYLAKFTDTTNLTAGPVLIGNTTNAALTGNLTSHSIVLTNSLSMDGTWYALGPEAGGFLITDGYAIVYRFRIDGTAVNLNDGVATTVGTWSVSTNAVLGATVKYTVSTRDAAYALQVERGSLEISGVNVDGTISFAPVVKTHTQVNSSGTLSTTWTLLQAGNTALLQLNADTSLTPTTLNVVCEVLNSYGPFVMN